MSSFLQKINALMTLSRAPLLPLNAKVGSGWEQSSNTKMIPQLSDQLLVSTKIQRPQVMINEKV